MIVSVPPSTVKLPSPLNPSAETRPSGTGRRSVTPRSLPTYVRSAGFRITSSRTSESRLCALSSARTVTSVLTMRSGGGSVVASYTTISTSAVGSALESSTGGEK